ncbi:hypothetical protein C5167_044922 [Papaver somniferum]|uniref:Uncharacterized protein n=1 Tax=Papaver somniferum TaxID=3469 RepID=A0A4Y7LAV8_PAPSO|nr:hypothetical protein C5167_044922 [Papaver somniferum]
MKSTNANRFHFVLSLSSLLFLIVSALTDETNSILTGHTNSNDVEATHLLMENYPLLGYLSTDDQDDPCIPEPQLCYSDKDVSPTATWTEASPGKYWGKYRRILAKSGKKSAKNGKKKKTAKVKSGKKKKTSLVLGIFIPIFLIFMGIGIFLWRIHRKRKAAAAAGLKNGTTEPAIPMYANMKSPNPLLPK